MDWHVTRFDPFPSVKRITRIFVNPAASLRSADQGGEQR